jgi:hypothetical protein
MSVRDIRLIAVDMDGTLLLPDGSVPDGLWPLLGRLRERASPSPRQRSPAGDAAADVRRRRRRSTTSPKRRVRGPRRRRGQLGRRGSGGRGIRRRAPARPRRGGSLRAGLVLCGKRSAYVEDTDPRFVAEVEKYYARRIVADLLAVDDQILKLAIYDLDGGEGTPRPRSPISPRPTRSSSPVTTGSTS